MPNPLTGDFDAIVQVSRGTVNRLLASLHQNDGEETDARTLPHATVIRIDDPALTGDAAGLRGTAYLQLGAPTVSLVPGAPHEADVAIWVRARYHADAKTTPMAEFVHTKVVARFRLAAEQTASGPGLRATVSDDDAFVTVSEHGLAAVDAARVAAVVRWYLRHKVDAVLPLSESLPPGAGELRSIHDAQGGTAVAFPVTLGGAPPAAAEPGGVILESSDFAVAVCKEYLLSLVQPSLDAIKAQHPTFSISTSVATAGYTVTLTKAQATWLPDGRIRIDVGGHANTPAWWAPNVSFDVGQDLQVAFTFPA